MAKVTNRWTNIYEWEGEKERPTKLGKKVYDLANLPDMVESFLYKSTYKRIRMAEERIDKFVRKTSNQLFLTIIRDAIGRIYNPYEDWSTVSVWEQLGRAYNRRKKPWHSDNQFWLYTGDLSDWMKTAKPSEIFGEPYVETSLNKKARGYQKVRFFIRPFPKASQPNINSSSDVYYKLFGRHLWREGYASNEDERPIIAPAMRKLMDTRIKNGVIRILKEVMENG